MLNNNFVVTEAANEYWNQAVGAQLITCSCWSKLTRLVSKQWLVIVIVSKQLHCASCNENRNAGNTVPPARTERPPELLVHVCNRRHPSILQQSSSCRRPFPFDDGHGRRSPFVLEPNELCNVPSKETQSNYFKYLHPLLFFFF